jgi:hypothetical protein
VRGADRSVLGAVQGVKTEPWQQQSDALQPFDHMFTLDACNSPTSLHWDYIEQIPSNAERERRTGHWLLSAI